MTVDEPDAPDMCTFHTDEAHECGDTTGTLLLCVFITVFDPKLRSCNFVIKIGELYFLSRLYSTRPKSKVGLAAAQAAALRINLNVQGCSIVAAPMHVPSLTSLLLPLLLSHNLPLPRVH